MKNNKATGRDGFPVEFYKQFSPLLLNHMVQTFNHVLTQGVIPPSWREARIIVLPKPGKDTSQVGAYRPISLLNHDMKIFTSLLAKRLNKFIAEYVHPDQSGFIPTRQITDNIRRSLNVINFCKGHKLKAVILGLDAKKAFDRVETSYLQILLSEMNFGPCFLAAIKALYAGPTAQILVNGIRSDDFTLTRGTRQGCPLSPILFALSLEPLAEAIRSRKDIRGVAIADTTHKINLFADDTVIYVSEPMKSLPPLLEILDDFGKISGFAINYTKSEAYPINLSEVECRDFHYNFKFKLVSKSWKHLGIFIPLRLQELFQVNFEPMLKKTRENFRDWLCLSLSWMDRLELLKMSVLPQFLFLFQNLPVFISCKTL